MMNSAKKTELREAFGKRLQRVRRHKKLSQEASAVMGCVRGRKISVMAIDADGNAGKWSEYSTVGCNSIRG